MFLQLDVIAAALEVGPKVSYFRGCGACSGVMSVAALEGGSGFFSFCEGELSGCSPPRWRDVSNSLLKTSSFNDTLDLRPLYRVRRYLESSTS